MNVESNETHVDVIGDVHGCYDELIELVETLGYVKSDRDSLYRHPEGRHLVFVGDLTDRGPKNRLALLFALRHAEAGVATYVMGNHDYKLGRVLKGNDVRIGHGLQDTLDELHDMSENQKLKLSERILGLPIFATFDDGKLLVAHAAPPPNGGSKRKTFSTCLYGHTTGRKTDAGFPERLNWVPNYNSTATDDTPFVVYGHVTHQEPYITDKACCIDTACFAGNELSAFRWPEHKVVSVKSRQTWEGETNLVLHDTKTSPTPTRGIDPSPITTLHLPTLLQKFTEREEEMLYLIDTDAKLKKREHPNGLVIANSSPSLFEPEEEHQLFAKGIVYTRDPYRLVSMPLVKMYNHTMREVSDKTTQEMLADPEVTVTFPEKADGTLIQLFEHDGEIYLTTRSVLEGTETERDEGNFDYTGEARRILDEKYPIALDPDVVRGFTFLFELIHPESRIVTDYGDLEDMILLAAYQHAHNNGVARYWPSSSLRRMDHFAGFRVTDYYEPQQGDFESNVKAILDELNAREDMPEGVIAVFEKGDAIQHRIKIKTQAYLRYHRLKFHCNFKSVVQIAWHNEDLHEWDAFLAYLRNNGLTEEEVESFYREHFDEFTQWLDTVKRNESEARTWLENFNTRVDKSDERAYYKTMAADAREEMPDLFGLIMQMARKGATLIDVMRVFPAYDGLKGEIDKWRKENASTT